MNQAEIIHDEEIPPFHIFVVLFRMGQFESLGSPARLAERTERVPFSAVLLRLERANRPQRLLLQATLSSGFGVCLRR